jgi:Fe-S-cluster containining protein
MATADEPLCARCSSVQKTCCQVREIYATPGDAARIAAFTGRDDFVRLAPPDDPDYLDQEDDPEWYRIFDREGRRRVLTRQSNGDCTFLGARGCTLPGDVRPLTCRLYPFEYSAAGIGAAEDHMCPTHLLRPGQALLQVLDMREEDAERARAQLYAEICAELNPPVAPGARDGARPPREETSR